MEKRYDHQLVFLFTSSTQYHYRCQCIWKSAIPSEIADEDEVEASQTEIFRLRKLVGLLMARLEERDEPSPCVAGSARKRKESSALSSASLRKKSKIAKQEGNESAEEEDELMDDEPAAPQDISAALASS